MKLLITGGCGFIGSALCRMAALHGHHILNFDKLTYAATLGSVGEISTNPNYTFMQADICDESALASAFHSFAPDAVMHLAAESHVDRSITGSADFVQTNIVGTHKMLEAARQYYTSLNDTARQSFRFLHISTDEVFGSLGEVGYFSENTAYDPRSPYSASKAASDHLVRAWGETYGLPVLISNCSNNYGPFQFPEKLIPLMILNAIERKPLPVYGDGKNVRDWLYVDDHVRALLLMLERGQVGQTYTIGGRSEQNNLDVVHTICHVLNAKLNDGFDRHSLIQFVQDRPGHDRRYAIDPSKIENELGWRPLETFESGISKTIDWYLSAEDWWGELRNGVYDGKRLGLMKA